MSTIFRETTMDGKSMTTEMNRTTKKRSQKVFNRTIVLIASSLIVLSAGFAIIFRVWAMFSEKKAVNVECEKSSVVDFNSNAKQSLKGDFRNHKSHCFIFAATINQKIEIESNIETTLIKPNQKIKYSSGLSNEIFTETGEYTVRVNKNGSSDNFEIKLNLLNTSVANSISPQINPPVTEPPRQNVKQAAITENWSYNVSTPPPFTNSKQTQEIVDKILSLSERKGLPTSRLSISLVDLTGNSCCSYGLYQDTNPRFPASITKLFWMVAFFGEFRAGKKGASVISQEDLDKMIQNSDNEPASSVLDWLTNTRSVGSLSKDELEIWQNNRNSVNTFFKKAGYQNINISQKNFPIPKLKLLKPEGSDLQMRGNLSNPLRNYLTTYETARLLYEIVTQQSVSPEDSQKMLELLHRNYELEKRKEYDSIKGFLGEKFSPSEIDLYSKAGWTSDSRQDAAIFFSRDGQAKYILVMFGDDPAFANDWDFFPDASRIVYTNMKR